MTQRKRKFLILMQIVFLRNHQSYKPEHLVQMTQMSIMKWILIIKMAIAMIKPRPLELTKQTKVRFTFTQFKMAVKESFKNTISFQR